MIVLMVRYRVKPGEMDYVVDALREMRERIRTDEPGCALFQVSRSREDPNALLLYEQYYDEDAFDAHNRTPHFEEIVLKRIVPRLDERIRALYSLEIE
jgi:quinol monooxygenase YgiN